MRRGQEGPVALKILKSQRANSEPYQRFKDEVAVLRSLGHHPGVLPILDAYLPDREPAMDVPDQVLVLRLRKDPAVQLRFLTSCFFVFFVDS